VRVAAGAPRETFEAVVALAQALYTVAVPPRYDIAIAGVGAPKDANLYQASRAPTYLHFAPVPSSARVASTSCRRRSPRGRAREPGSVASSTR